MQLYKRLRALSHCPSSAWTHAVQAEVGLNSVRLALTQLLSTKMCPVRTSATSSLKVFLNGQLKFL